MCSRCDSPQKVPETLFCTMTVCLLTEHRVNMVVLRDIFWIHTHQKSATNQLADSSDEQCPFFTFYTCCKVQIWHTLLKSQTTMTFWTLTKWPKRSWLNIDTSFPLCICNNPSSTSTNKVLVVVLGGQRSFWDRKLLTRNWLICNSCSKADKCDQQNASKNVDKLNRNWWTSRWAPEWERRIIPLK